MGIKDRWKRKSMERYSDIQDKSSFSQLVEEMIKQYKREMGDNAIYLQGCLRGYGRAKIDEGELGRPFGSRTHSETREILDEVFEDASGGKVMMGHYENEKPSKESVEAILGIYEALKEL